MIKNYLKIAWRSLLKNKTTSFINITGLSVGMAAAVLIMLWVQNELNFDNYHNDADKIYRLTTHIPETGWTWESTPLRMAETAKKEIPEIERATKLFVNNMPIFNINGHAFFQKKCAYVDNEWFNVFHFDFIEGGNTAFNQNPFSIILTEKEAKKYFNNHVAVGATIRIDSINYQVSGVVADAPSNSSFQYDAFIPIAALLSNPQQRENDEQWNNYNYLTFIKLSPQSTPVMPMASSRNSVTVVSQKLTNIMQRSKEEGAKISLTPLLDMHFETGLQESSFVQGNRNAVYIFSIIAFLLLLIACINYVNLATAKASLRAKEVSVRKIIGANRSHLFYQFITEYVLISVLALSATLLLIQISLPIFNMMTDKQFIVPLTSVKMWQIIGFTLFAALLLNSIYPAILLSSFQPLNVFRGITVLKVKDAFLRKGLVVLQFSFSVMLIACTFIIYRQMQFIQQTNVGYNRAQVLSFPLPPNVGRKEKEALIENIKQELLTQSSIESVTAANQPLVNVGSVCSQCADWDGRATDFNPKLAQLSTDADFFKTMQPQMLEGRWFQKEITTDKHNVILNETATKELNIKQPIIGQRFIFKGDTGQIVGVVKDFKYKNMREKSGSVVIFNNSLWHRFLMVRIAPKNITAGVPPLKILGKNTLQTCPLNTLFWMIVSTKCTMMTAKQLH
jgi:putative ABC transport system permease protein